MLGWMIKRGLDGGGRDAAEEADDTQVEQPDTPGPVFAARALKSAIFGTPARPDIMADNDDDDDNNNNKNNRDKQQTEKQSDVAASLPGSLPEATPNVRDRTAPGRLPGILLTPGTATARRKRVSFGNNVEYDENNATKPEFKVDGNGSKRNLFGDDAKKPRTTLALALENARQQNNKTAMSTATAMATATDDTENPADDDNIWEEVCDNDTNNNDWDPDVTVDLNEPHSQSGRYWKSQFQRYQEDAKAEMSKLLKYKQLAKSYAKMKDSEAGDMQARLCEEKEKVAQMEARITELAGQIARQRTKGSDRDYQDLISELTRQTALAVQYRNQVKELDAMLQDADADDVFRQHGDGSETASSLSAAGRRRGQSAFLSAATSPRTQKTLLDTQRELRRARDQAKELALVKDEVRRLKTALRDAEHRASSSENESRALAADLASSVAASSASASRVHDLEKRATFAEDERRRKDDELRQLQRKYDELKEDAKARVGEAEQVLRRKNEQIADLKRQLKGATVEQDLVALPAAAAATNKTDKPTALAALEKVTRSRYENLANRRSLEVNKAPASSKPQSRADGLDGLVLDTHELDLNDTDEPELPQQKLSSKHRAQLLQPDDEPIDILEDETSHFELPPARPVASRGAVTTTARTALGARSWLRKDVQDEDNNTTTVNNNNQDAVAAANRILLRRRRTTAGPLRSTEARHNGLFDSSKPPPLSTLAGIDAADTNDRAERADRADRADRTNRKYRPLPTRKRLPSSAVVHNLRATSAAAAAAAGGAGGGAGSISMGRERIVDPVTAAAAAAADASSLSISSSRAAAAVARIEQRRAQRQRELGLQQNKENMQPA